MRRFGWSLMLAGSCLLLACGGLGGSNTGKGGTGGPGGGDPGGGGGTGGEQAIGKDGKPQGWSSDPKVATDPTGENTPLQSGSEKEADDALKAAGESIDEYRAKGVTMFISELRKDLQGRGMSTAAIDKIEDKIVGQPLPSQVDATGKPAQPPAGSPPGTPAGKTEYAKYFYCPILAPEPGGANDSCVKLVEASALKVSNEIDQSKPQIEQNINTKHATMAKEARDFIVTWAITAIKYGANVASIYATQELRAAGQCDTKLNAMQISHLLGVEQGQKIVISHYPEAQAQAAACGVNTDLIAQQIKTIATSEIKKYMEDHPVCVDNDVSKVNAVLQQAELKREEGIKEGIAIQTEILRALLRVWQVAACARAGAGDPLALDLDGRGLELASKPATFDLLADGHPQRVSWVGPRTSLLAIDLDGNGRIDSGAELFGDRSSCGSARCYDGVSALAAYDANRDGFVDASDPVYSRLRLWNDADQDGVSQPEELSTLCARGVLAISVQASYRTQRLAGAASTAELQVLTTGGLRTAYDLWLEMRLGRANLASLMPAR